MSNCLRITWRIAWTVPVLCLTLVTIGVLAGWICSFWRSSWTLNPEHGLSSGLYERGDESWRLLVTLDHGWWCMGYTGHTCPKWHNDWQCGGPGAVLFDGMSHGRACRYVFRTGWRVPLGGRWMWCFRAEDEAADWLVCRDTGTSTEVFQVDKNHEEWSRARLTPDVWTTPGRIGKHIVFRAAIPFWALTLITGAVPGLSFVRWTIHRRRRNRGGSDRCRQCAYDLRGNVSGICPECGLTIVHQGDRLTENARTTW